MGCDIHASVEWNRHNDWWPVTLDAGFLPRDYELFSCLVDGHGRDWQKIGGVAPERGLPPGPSSAAEAVIWWREHHGDEHCHYPDAAVGWGDHTFSWLTPEEYQAALKRYRDHTTREPDPEYVALGAYLDSLAAHGAVRLVFSFDN